MDASCGALLSLAVGDAQGTTQEFREPGTFAPISDLVGGGPFGLLGGQWTDETRMALCVAESLVEKQMFGPRERMKRHVRWWDNGQWSSIGRCFNFTERRGRHRSASWG